jgi:DNA-binding SARP family transcriptional activator
MMRLFTTALEHGIEVEYVQGLIRKRKLAPTPEVLHLEHWPWPIKIRTLGAFRLEKDGEPVRFPGKVQRRPLDLLKITIALGGREVDTRRIIDGLWPEAEGDAAEDAFASALRRLRLLLGDPAALALQDDKLSLDPQRVWVDAWALEHLLERKDAAPADFAQVLALYRGAFLEKESGAAWAWPLRERLRNRFLRELARHGQLLMRDKHCEEAIRLFERGLEADDLAEELYCNLMRCYQALGRRAEALGVYERCRKLLSSRLGVTPSPETEALRHALRGN